ncbi:MAG TPA: ectonucleotide pyrophosphatase/phosphodiesterase [Methylomirabilota bacterium]|nr:ectonucleotide pyrophosphatase/phosphodiesterase [Methylomirabilota bacterium]
MPRLILISIDGLAHFYWSDPRAPMPVLRGLAERGAHAAGGMGTVFVSTTWPCHVSIVTGVGPRAHGVISNHVLNRATSVAEDFTGDPIYDAADLVRAPTFYDRAHAAGLRTAAIDWPATRRARSLDFNLPMFKSQRHFEAHTDAAVWNELRELGYPVERQGEWAELPRRFLKDAMVVDLAIDVLKRHAPDVLLVHFLCADSHQHLYGPRSPEAYWAIAYIDALVGRLLAALGADGLELTSVVIVSDHGFLPVSRDIRPNVRLRKRGLLRLGADGAIAGGEARFVTNGGSGWVYLAGGGDSGRLGRDLRVELAAMDGVAGAWTAEEYATLGLPAPADEARAGDVIVEAAPGFMLSDEGRGDDEHGTPKYRGNHGQRPQYDDNHAMFLAAGRGVKRGVTLGRISSRDVAPTLTALLGLPPAPAEGRLLTEILA